jgi:hypothetical protein
MIDRYKKIIHDTRAVVDTQLNTLPSEVAVVIGIKPTGWTVVRSSTPLTGTHYNLVHNDVYIKTQTTRMQ